MKVKDLFSRDLRTCGLATNLSTVGWIMWDGDCGVVPVVDTDGKALGVITDRDIAIAAATKYRPASEITVQEVMSGKIHFCAPEDDVHHALKLMRTEKIRRLLVLDPSGKLLGLLSMNDLILAAHNGKGRSELTYEAVMLALQTISSHRTKAVKKETEVVATC